uniref:Putative pancreatic triacylglycerol lipase n=1 Tax=Corethrella appendiculata TaxID=1370023 RepID=U5ETF1_9DIPT
MHISNNTGGFLLQTMLYLANQKADNTLFDAINNSNYTKPPDSNEVKCYGVYGCFPLSAPWTDERRPIAYHPESPKKLDVQYPVFNRYTRDIPKFIDINDPDYVKRVGINPKGKIYFIVHGYIESGDRPWIQGMVNALLDNDKYSSAIVVDWRGGSSPPYTQAVANIRLVGAITAHVIHLIYEELQLPNLDKIHMIGHSLGSHLSGYTGYYLQKDFGLQLGRISALDPAEPLFSLTDPIVRLDKTDAKFIDVVHTDASPFVVSMGLGLYEPIGHIDFYPNGGHDQPSCDQPMRNYIDKESGSFFWGVQEFLGCNHLRSIQFYTESISNKNCPFMSITCESYDAFKNGDCFKCNENGHLCLEFGFRSYESYKRIRHTTQVIDNQPIKAYLMTKGEKPFCRTHYKVTVKVSSSEESILHGGEIGIMSIIIRGHHNNVSEKIDFAEESTYYEPGEIYSTVIPANSVGIPQEATLNWEYKYNPLNPLTWRILSSPRVYVEYIILESLEHRSRIRLCPIFQMPVVAGQPSVFIQENCHRLPEHY